MVRFQVWQRGLLILAAGFFLCGFDLSPENWVRDIGKLWERNTPKVQNITFWDFESKEFRGIRSLFYTVPKERENRMVDQRLYLKMTQFLSVMCREVVTLDSFEDPNQKRSVEQILIQLVDQWKLKGEIDPATLFKQFPAFRLDILVLMERIYYDQVWKNNQKWLAIGINAAAFEMDFGKPLYQDRMIVEVPWTGESISYQKAEHAALLKVADAMGMKLQAMADEINRAHIQLEEQQLAEQKKQEAARIAQLNDESEKFALLVKQAQKILDAKIGPSEILEPLQKDVTDIKPLLAIPLRKTPLRDNFRSPYFKEETKTLQGLTEEEIATRQKLADSIQTQIALWQSWKEKEEEQRKQQEIANQPTIKRAGVSIPSATPSEPPGGIPLAAPSQESWVGIPSVHYPKGQLFERRWLLPSTGAVQASPIPILPAGGVSQPEIQSSPLPNTLPDSFRRLTPENLPPVPQAAGIPVSAT